MLSPGQHGKLSPVVIAAWKQHCATRGLNPSRKKVNGYRAWYEGMLQVAIGSYSTSAVKNAKDYGKVLAEFASAANDEKLIRRLADDDERRLRWALRMLCVDLSFLRGTRVGWEYIRSTFGQAKLPPGDFDNCPAEYLAKIIAMLDTQIRRECTRNMVRKCELPRRARHPHDSLDAIATIAARHAFTTDDLIAWHKELLTEAKEDIRRGRTHDFQQPSVTSDHTTTQGDIPF